MTMTYGPRTKAADALHAMKHRGPGEDFREAMNRVAFGLHDDDRHYKEFREILLDMRFLPAGRVQTAVGAARHTTAYNCFVSGVIADSLVEGPGCIMDRLKEAVTTLRLGGGIGYDISTMRPRGDKVAKLDTQSSGPVEFLKLFNTGGDVTAGVGDRRGAQMGIMRVDHPDIEEFVRAKQNEYALRRFNLSVAVTEEFMEAAYAGKDFDLRWGGRTYKTIDAASLWEQVMRSTWDWGEPGVFFVDRVNRMNNLWYCETIATTNPCGEQPLPPYGACLLGSFNLVKYLRKGPTLHEIGDARYSFDYDQLAADVPAVVRAMDNVVDRARYPLAEQRHEAMGKRRMGLGVTGLANAGEACGHAYGSPGFLQFESDVLCSIRDRAYAASAALAKEKGPFALFDAERYLRGGFAKTLPDDVRHEINLHGIRNSHLTSIAPTGTISMVADNVSSGLEPVLSYKVERPVTTFEGITTYALEDYGASFLGVRGKLAANVSATEHVVVLATAQKYVDSSVSKTVNMTGAMPWSDFKGIYRYAYEEGCKSCTTFNADGKRGSLLAAEGVSCEIDPDTGARECG